MTLITSRAKILAVLLLILIPLVVLGIVLEANVERQRAATQELRQAFEVVSLASTLAGRLADMQVSVEGVFITGEEVAARELERDYATFLVGVAGLRRMVSGERADRLARIEDGVRAWRQGAASATLLAIVRGRWPEGVRLARQARAEMDGLREGMLGFIRAQEQELTGRTSAQDDAQQRAVIEGALVVLAIGLGAGLLLLVGRIRAKRVLVESEERFRALFEAAPVAYHEIDTAGVVRRVNRAECDLLDYGPDDLLGKAVWELVAPELQEAARAAVLQKLALQQPLAPFEREYVRRDGTRVTVEIHENLIQDRAGHVAGIRSALLNITERKSIERMKDEFVSVVSHELRTPLTSIRGALGLLAGGLLGPVSERGQRMLDIAVSNTDRLVRLINDILDIERMESGKIVANKETCNIAELLVQAGEVMRPMAEKAGVTLTVVPLAAHVWADPDRLLQVFTNLLSNAIKFAPAASEVRLGGVLEGEEVLLRVQDQGRGIPPDKLESIFERFHQVDASDSREKGGSGLGLAICRSIVAQHAGKIWADSVLGQGSTLSVRLPVLCRASVSRVPLSAPPGRVVLLCEEDPEVRQSIQGMLERGGYSVRVSEAGEDAVQLARAERPAAILLGFLASDRDGWTTLGKLKEEAETREIPVIFLSSPAEAMRPLRSSDRVAGRLLRPPDEGNLLRVLQQAGAGRTMQVVVVEDDADLAQILLAIFQRHGAAVRHAAGGREAVRLCQENPPDLMVLDVGLPDGDGFSVVEGLRRDPRLRATPLVVYTAQDLSPADRERLQLGQTEFFTKSRISPEELEGHIVGLMRRIVLNQGERESEDGEACPAGG